ncbi:MAG: aminotransferase class III-fold pyridoxal phosphate-dependent enzyme [bacterium]|nr:aminotransferase class III-fold pyridoxal phosphate-dependent enzyme [bacterium]
MRKKISTKNGVALWNKAKKIIPGGNQLLSKRSEMFLPDQWPSYYKKAKGAEIWDLDGNKFIDMTIMGVGSCILGYADDDVNKAVKQVIDKGSMNTLNSTEEVELAELLLKLHPWAGMVRYARTGGESMAVAVRIARAYSGKDKIAFCGYHGWQDWYLASNLSDKKHLDGHLLPGLEPKGVPRGLKGSAIPFNYNRIDELEKIVKKHKDIGVIIVEPLRHQEPTDNFLKKVKKIANRIGAVLVFDEITIAWRLNAGGAHLLYGVNPDMAVFAKAMSNGYPMAAIIGKKNVMQSAQDTFISSTYWTERVGPAAALATIKKIQKEKAYLHIKKIGRMIWQGWEGLAGKHGLKIKVVGPEALVTFSLKYGEESQALRTLFTQEMLKRGFLATPSVYVSFAHKEKHVKAYLKAVDSVFALLRKAVDQKKIHKFLKGPVAHSDFKRLT